MDPAKWGRVVESAVGAHLLNNSIAQNYSLYYWRESNYEVDFVMVLKGRIVALEVKSVYRERRAEMEQFRKYYPDAKVSLVGRLGIRWEDFIAMDPMQLF